MQGLQQLLVDCRASLSLTRLRYAGLCGIKDSQGSPKPPSSSVAELYGELLGSVMGPVADAIGSPALDGCCEWTSSSGAQCHPNQIHCANGHSMGGLAVTSSGKGYTGSCNTEFEQQQQVQLTVMIVTGIVAAVALFAGVMAMQVRFTLRSCGSSYSCCESCDNASDNLRPQSDTRICAHWPCVAFRATAAPRGAMGSGI